MDAKKVIKKHDRNRVLAALSYVAGFPLLILMVLIGSIPFINGTGFESTRYYGIIICLALWLVVTVIQIIVSLITRNFTTRAVVLVLFTLIIMIGGAVIFDIWAEKQVDTARETYVRNVLSITDDTESEDYLTVSFDRNYSNKEVPVLTDKDGKTVKTVNGIDVNTLIMPITNFNHQVNHYVKFTEPGLAKDYSEVIADFCRVYNIEVISEVKGKVNTDGSAYGKAPVNEDGESIYLFGEKGEVYKENGLYADGYIFSMPVALEILTTYYAYQHKYASSDEEYAGQNAEERLADALEKAEKSSEWKSYKTTKEYKDAYGTNGTVENFMINEARLDRIVKALGKGLYEEGIYDMVLDLNFVLSMIGVNLEELGINETTLKNLSLDKLLDLVASFGLEIEAEQIMEILAPFSSYEVSNVKPLMAFIEDEETRMYAYAKYFGETHGANIGSVLIPNSNGKIGEITMNASGLSAEENAFTLNELYELKANNSYIPMLYPLFAARRYAYVFAGIIALMFVIFYYAKTKVYLTGKKLQRMSERGGMR